MSTRSRSARGTRGGSSTAPSEAAEPTLIEGEMAASLNGGDDDDVTDIRSSRKYYELGMNVWAKMDDCRPWPGYILNKRRPTNQDTRELPVMFFGPRDEYAWIDLEYVIPLTHETLGDFCRDLEQDNEFVMSVHQAFIENAFPCTDCSKCFKSLGDVKVHYGHAHISEPCPTEHTFQLKRAMFRYNTALLADTIRTQDFASAILPSAKFPPFSAESSSCLRNMFVSATPVENVTEEQLRAEIEREEEERKRRRDAEEEEEARKRKATCQDVDDDDDGDNYDSAMQAKKRARLTARQSFMKAPVTPSKRQLPDGITRDEESEYALAQIRVGDNYQVAVIPPAETFNEEFCRFGKEKPVWLPEEKMTDLPGYSAYFKFAQHCKGLKLADGKHFRSLDPEYAHHVFYSNYRMLADQNERERQRQLAKLGDNAKAEDTLEQDFLRSSIIRGLNKPVATQSLLDFTKPERARLQRELNGYHYTGNDHWTKREHATFVKGFEEYGKQFGKLSEMIDSKTTAQCVEHYYSVYRLDPDYKRVKAILKEREREEMERAQEFGVVSACDHCHITQTVRWWTGPKDEDWCDDCYRWYKKHKRLPKQNASVIAARKRQLAEREAAYRAKLEEKQRRKQELAQQQQQQQEQEGQQENGEQVQEVSGNGAKDSKSEHDGSTTERDSGSSSAQSKARPRSSNSTQSTEPEGSSGRRSASRLPTERSTRSSRSASAVSTETGNIEEQEESADAANAGSSTKAQTAGDGTVNGLAQGGSKALSSNKLSKPNIQKGSAKRSTDTISTSDKTTSGGQSEATESMP